MEVLCFFTLNKLIILLEWSSPFTPFILRIKTQTEYVLNQRVGSLFLMYRTNCLDIYYIHLSNISHQLLVSFHQRASFFIWSGEIFLQCRDYVKKLLLYGQEKVWENHGNHDVTMPQLTHSLLQSGIFPDQQHVLLTLKVVPASLMQPDHQVLKKCSVRKKNKFTCLQKIGSCASGGITT